MSIDFIDTLFKLRPPPCETCRHFEKCRDEKLACTTFKAYVGDWDKKKHERDPARLHYNDLFTDEIGFQQERHGDQL